MELKTRLQTLWEFIDKYLEVDYGYIPRESRDDEEKVDEYIETIKEDFKSMRARGIIAQEFIQESINLLKRLDNL